MVTMVGTENDTRALLSNLIQMEHDAIAAYDAVIEKLENFGNKQQIRKFRSDHESHLENLEKLAAKHGAFKPDSTGMKSMLTTGKVNVANMLGGDKATLKAMSTNESDTISAYRNACNNKHAPEDAQKMLQGALADEERHKEWMDEAAKK